MTAFSTNERNAIKNDLNKQMMKNLFGQSRFSCPNFKLNRAIIPLGNHNDWGDYFNFLPELLFVPGVSCLIWTSAKHLFSIFSFISSLSFLQLLLANFCKNIFGKFQISIQFTRTNRVIVLGKIKQKHHHPQRATLLFHFKLNAI